MTAEALDLFCGAGGATIALERHGLATIGIDNDPHAVETHLAAGWPTIAADVATCIGGLGPDAVGYFDTVHASPPCQPFTAPGQARGHLDPRDRMPAALDAIATLRPRLATLENVAGIAHPRHRPYLVDALERLELAGYRTAWRILNAADYGTPQTRRRLIIVARLDGPPTWPTPTNTEGAGLFTKPWRTIGDALPYLNPTVRLRPGRHPSPGDATGNRRAYRLDETAPTIAFGHDVAAWTWETPDGRTLGRIDLEDLAVLQGFPNGYPFAGPPTALARQVGNALPPELLGAVLAANAATVTAAELEEAPRMTKPLTWARIDADFWHHPKVVGLTDRARLIYLAGLTWTVAHLTDGHIPTAALDTIAPTAARGLTGPKARRYVTELEAAHLWHPHPAGWTVHNYAERQITRDDLAAQRTARAEAADRQRRYRQRRSNGQYAAEDGPDPPAGTPPKPPPVTRHVTRHVTRDKAVTSPSQTASRNGPGDASVTPQEIEKDKVKPSFSLSSTTSTSAREAAAKEKISSSISALANQLKPPEQAQ